MKIKVRRLFDRRCGAIITTIDRSDEHQLPMPTTSIVGRQRAEQLQEQRDLRDQTKEVWDE